MPLVLTFYIREMWSRVVGFVGPHIPSNTVKRSFLFLTLVLLPLLALALSQPRSVSLLLINSLHKPHAHRTSESKCFNPPRDNCSFYSDCLESRYHCGPAGYPLGYGKYFCQKFSTRRSLLSPNGQTWMLDTMHCLQLALVPEGTGEVHTTCQALEDKAFATHAGCYIGSGVCELPVSDWLAVLDIVHVKTLFESRDAFKASVEAGSGCAEFYAWLLARDLF